MTIYEGVTLGFIGIGVIIIIFALFFDRTKKVVDDDEAALDDETFRKQINLVNDKVIELNEYHTFVQEEIEKKHKELLFLYQMISEKEKDIRKIQLMIEQKKDLLEAEIDVKKKINQSADNIMKKESPEITTEINPVSSENIFVSNRNKKIIELDGKGYTIKEIAQILDIGQGEVRLVLNLFR